MRLKKVESAEVVPIAPFNFDATFHKPDHFTSGDNYWEAGIRWQTWRHKGQALGIKFINYGRVNIPKIKIEIYSKTDLSKEFIDCLLEEIKYRFNLKLDLSEFYDKFTNDSFLNPIIKKFFGMRPGHPSSLYEYLIIGIVLQNATVKRSVQMFENLLTNYGDKIYFDDKQLFCFWNPGDLSEATEDELRELKVGYRARSIKKIDEHFWAGKIIEKELREKNRETQMDELLNLYGVGPATVWYILFDVFHHWDFFNHISPWEQKIYSKLFFDQNPDNPVSVDKILKHFERYGEYKQLAIHYIWEDLWWKRKKEHIPWLENLIRL